MKRKISILLALLLLASCGAQKSEEDIKIPSLSYQDEDYQERFEATRPSQEALDALWEFSTTSFELLRKEDNTFYSPMSLYFALSMLKEGASGESLAELESLLYRDLASKDLLEHLYADSEDIKSLLANSLWVQEDFEVKEDFKKKLEEEHYATTRSLDLKTQKSMDLISQWIKDNTQGKIDPKLSPEEAIKLYLVNTLYLKSAWLEPFDESATTPDTFQGLSENLEIDFMNARDDKADYAENERLQIGERLLKEGVAVYFIRPQDGLSPRDLSLEEILQAKESLSAHSVSWSIPKTSLEDELELSSALKELGLESIFEEDGKLYGISDSPLSVSLIKQWSDLEIDEGGLEASAATMIGIRATSMPLELPQASLKLDKPFSILITFRDIPLFLGDVYRPQ